MCQTGSLFTCAVFTRNLESPCSTTKGGRVNVWVSCVCYCVCTTCTIRSNTWAQQPILQLYLQFIEVWPALFGAWPPALSRLSAPGRKVERERAWAREGAALTSGARCGNNGDAPHSDSGRQEQAQTQEPSILPLRQTCRGLRIWGRNCLWLASSLSRLFLICPNMTKKWCTCWLYAVISQWSLRETLRAPQSRRE